MSDLQRCIELATEAKEFDSLSVKIPFELEADLNGELDPVNIYKELARKLDENGVTDKELITRYTNELRTIITCEVGHHHRDMIVRIPFIDVSYEDVEGNRVERLFKYTSGDMELGENSSFDFISPNTGEFITLTMSCNEDGDIFDIACDLSSEDDKLSTIDFELFLFIY